MKYYLSVPCPTGDGLEKKYVADALDKNQAATGEYSGLFEESVKGFTGTANALAVVNGTSAIHLALLGLGVERGDTVLSSTFTFIGSVAPVTYIGAEPVFIDSDRATWNMDPNLLEDELKRRSASGKMPKALLLTHIYGQPADMESICGLCEKYGVYLVEDAAESLGAVFDGRQTGTFGAAGIYSFNANKVITSGGGGMLVSPDEKLTDHAKFLANQAKDPADHYEHTVIGYNYRISNMQCAHGYAQMNDMSERISKRRTIFEGYKKALSGMPVTFMPEHEKARGSRWLTAVTFDGEDRESIFDYLRGEGIETRPLWKPMHMQPVFADAESVVNGTSEEFFEYGLCLPSDNSLTDEGIAEIAEKIIRIL